MDRSAYEDILSEMTEPLDTTPTAAELIRYATLAANSHNTQPWTFKVAGDVIRIAPDLLRRTPVVDPDDHHLFASLGCAAENLSIAARARGFSGEVEFSSGRDGDVAVRLTPTKAEETPLFAAIPERQCCRSDYDGNTLPAETLARLMQAASRPDVEVKLITERKVIEDVLALLIAGNSLQIDDPSFVAELKSWLRFSMREAVESRDGLYSAASGNPELPRFLASPMFDWFFTKDSENDKLAKQVRSAAGLAVFVSASDDKPGWFSAGRAFQRFALQATIEDVRHAFVNQAVEVPEIRRELQKLLDLGERRPDLIVRFGYGPQMPRSLRRQVKDVMT